MRFFSQVRISRVINFSNLTCKEKKKVLNKKGMDGDAIKLKADVSLSI